MNTDPTRVNTTYLAQPPVDRNIPIITPAGGTAVAYLDPNSPEALMRKTKELEVQANSDRQFDVNTRIYKEGFVGTPHRGCGFLLLVLALIALVFPKVSRAAVILIAVILVGLCYIRNKKNVIGY